MILTPHILAGAAIGSKFKTYKWFFILIILSLASHFILDMFPHYEYSIDGLRDMGSFYFYIDVLKVVVDLFAGIAMVYLTGSQRKNSGLIISSGLIAALPDFFMFLSWHFNFWLFNFFSYLNHLFHFSVAAQASPMIGFLTEIIVTIAAIIILRKQKPDEIRA